MKPSGNFERINKKGVMPMSKKEFMTEKHLKQRTTFRILGPTILGIGILCSFIAAIDLFTLSPFEEPKYFWLFFCENKSSVTLLIF